MGISNNYILTFRQKSKIRKDQELTRHVENVHTKFRTDCTINKARFPLGVFPLQNPMAKFDSLNAA